MYRCIYAYIVYIFSFKQSFNKYGVGSLNQKENFTKYGKWNMGGNGDPFEMLMENVLPYNG